MTSISANARDRLINALLKLPQAEHYAGRTALLAGLPPLLARTENAATDITNIVTQLESHFSSDGKWNLLVFIDNAKRQVVGSELGRQLEELQQELESFERAPLAARAGLGRSLLRDYLYLFDRADQETLFLDALSVFPEQSPVPPVVVVISGLPDDEADLMLVRIMQRAIPTLYGSPYQKTVPHMLNWVTTVSVAKLVRELAHKILGVPTLRDGMDDLVLRMKDRIAGQTVCMTLPAHLITPLTAQILGEFFGQWSRLGAHERPPIFFLVVLDREAQNAAPENFTTPADAYAVVKKACTPSGELVTVVDHLTLNPCDPNHIRIWRSDLDETPIEKELVKSVCDWLEMKLGGLTTFRLRKVKSELGAHLGIGV